MGSNLLYTPTLTVPVSQLLSLSVSLPSTGRWLQRFNTKHLINGLTFLCHFPQLENGIKI